MIGNLVSTALNELKTLNGMNITKIGGIVIIFISLFFFFISNEGERLRTLSIIGIAVGAIWVLYAAALALSLIKEKGIVAYTRWEWAQLGDTLLATSTKFMWQMLLFFGLGLLFIADGDYLADDSKNDKVRSLGVGRTSNCRLLLCGTDCNGVQNAWKKMPNLR